MNDKTEQRRLEKLALVQEQVDNGSLVIRKMTDEERMLYPPRPVTRRRRGSPRRPAGARSPEQAAA